MLHHCLKETYLFDVLCHFIPKRSLCRSQWPVGFCTSLYRYLLMVSASLSFCMWFMFFCFVFVLSIFSLVIHSFAGSKLKLCSLGARISSASCLVLLGELSICSPLLYFIRQHTCRDVYSLTLCVGCSFCQHLDCCLLFPHFEPFIISLNSIIL